MKRLHNLDYLRGLAAFGIMLYHYLSWYTSFSSDSLMGRIGVYGVSMFYLLSGLTLFYVYHHRIEPSLKDLKNFYKKRIFRIFPLLWLVTILSVLMSRQIPDLTDLFLNLTGLFGFLKWDTYFATGVWSIGNELVFYVFFPFFVFFSKKLKGLFFLSSVFIFLIYVYFAFAILSNDLTLGEQWHIYVNPLNQVFLFLGGFLIGFFLKDSNLNGGLPLLIGLVLFIFYPAAGDPIELVTGFNRLAFTLACFLICIGFYKLSFEPPALISKPLSLLGEASYSVYLLHPIVYSVVGFGLSLSSQYLYSFPEYIKPILAIFFTLFASNLVYRYIEKYFMNLARH